MVTVNFVAVIICVLPLISDSHGSEISDDGQNDDVDSLNCNEGRNPVYEGSDPILYPGLIQMEKRSLYPLLEPREFWIISYDPFNLSWVSPDHKRYYVTDTGLNEYNEGKEWSKAVPRLNFHEVLMDLTFDLDEREDFRRIFAYQYLLDRIKRVSLIFNYYREEFPKKIPKSSVWVLQKLVMYRDMKELVFNSSHICDKECKITEGNPLTELLSCGTFNGKSFKVNCITENLRIKDLIVIDYSNPVDPEYLVDVPNSLKQEFHAKMDWLLDRLAQRMKNYMEMAFAKNHFRKTPTDLYNKINLQISKIRGGENLEPSKSVDLIYNALFDLNVYLNVTNTLFVFDKLAIFGHYLKFISRFSRWQLDTTKYANFFEPLKDVCLHHIGIGASLARPVIGNFELDQEVYHLTGRICKENVLYIIDDHATVGTIKSGVYDNAHCPFDTVFVLGKLNFTLNEDLKLPGKNLVIFSPNWIIVRKQTIDLSGMKGQIGEVGSDGGDLFAFGTKFKSSHLLTVISRGGDGGKGKTAKNTVRILLHEKDVKCFPKNVDNFIRRYGAGYGAPGGEPGVISFKFIRDRSVRATIIRGRGKKGKDGVVRNITVRCGSKIAVVPVSSLQHGTLTGKRVQKMTEAEILEIFRKMVREHSQRLPFGVLEFYKLIWTSPLLGLTLNSTVIHFLNVSDYSKDSKEFYDVTSQILHAQIRKSYNMTASEKVLLELALLRINMESPLERVLPSVIDIDSYLTNVSTHIKLGKIERNYFKIKEVMFRKVIEDAENYLRESLLPSLRETIESTNSYLRERLSDDLPRSYFTEMSFQECLAGNPLLRHLATLFQHVQLTLKDFVEQSGAEGANEPNCEILEKKLHFYRNVRNRMTANQMNAMQELLKLLKSGVKITGLSAGNLCIDCRQKIHKLLEELIGLQSKNNDCQQIAKYLLDHPDCADCERYERASQVNASLIENYRFFSGEQFCKRCPCAACRLCKKCKSFREFDEIEKGLFFPVFKLQHIYETNLFTDDYNTSTAMRQMNELDGDGTLSHHLRSFIDRASTTNPRTISGGIRSGVSVRNDGSREGTGNGIGIRNDVPDDTGHLAWSQCLADVGSRSDKVFNKGNRICDEKVQSDCSYVLKSLRNMRGRADEEDNAIKCIDCKTLDNFSERLSFEITKCKGDRASKSICSPSKGYPFTTSGCDPETFSRTFEEIRDHFVQEYSRTASNGENENETDGISINLVYALASVDLLLTEGIPVTEKNVNAIPRGTTSFMRMRDLNKDYERRVAELHDFSETDVYDMFTAELWMQNERLHLTSKWWAQLEKLVPWIRKVITFIGRNSKFEEVSERTLEAVKIVSEIVHNIKVVEHYRNLGDYREIVNKMDEIGGREVSEFKAVFEKTFVADVYNKAIEISENWMFPMTKTLSQLRNTLSKMQNSTHLSRLRIVAEDIQQHKKDLSVYTKTNQNKTFFYQWFPSATLIEDLMNGKPVILVSEILDGKEFNAITAKDFQMVLQTGFYFPQRVLDEALLGHQLEITHSGISYFKFGSRLYRRLTDTFTFRHSASIIDREVTPSKIGFVLSPFTTWIVRMKRTGGKELSDLLKKEILSIKLYGTDRYILNCADIPNVNENFSPLNNYRRKNCYYCY